MSSLELLPEHVIELWTRNGTHRIELLSGDITALPMEDKVNIFMASAFPGRLFQSYLFYTESYWKVVK